MVLAAAAAAVVLVAAWYVGSRRAADSRFSATTRTFPDVRPDGARGAGPEIALVTSANTARIRNALNAVAEARGNATILFIGDSLVRGSHSGSDGMYKDAHTRGMVGALAGMILEREKLPTSIDSAIGTGNVRGRQNQYDTAIASAGSFTSTGTDPAFTSLGGGMFRMKASGSDNAAGFRYVPRDAVDRFVIRSITRPGLGSLRYRVGKSEWTTIPQDGEPKFRLIDIVLGNKTRNAIEISSGTGSAAFAGLEAFDSGKSVVRLLNAGFAGSTATRSWTNDRFPWSPLSRVRDEPADLKVIALGTNDIDDGVELADYIDAMVRLIDAAKRRSDVAVLAPPPQAVDANNSTRERQLAFNEALRALCKEKDVAFVDQYQLFGSSHALAAERGWMDDALHPTAMGARRQAEAMFRLIETIRKVS